MSESIANEEQRLWEFAERTAKQVENWPSWKKEGWAVLDERNYSSDNRNSTTHSTDISVSERSDFE